MKQVISAVLLFACAGAHAATIDFEEFNLGDGPADYYGGSVLQTQGFDFAGLIMEGIYGPDGQPYIVNGNSGSKALGGSISDVVGQDTFGARVTITMERTDGNSFALYDFDFFADHDVDGYSSVVGYVAGGGSASGAVGTGDWLNLTSVTFQVSGSGFWIGHATAEVDNIVVGAAVPVPAAVWLFGSALGALGWVRRRRLS